ncbi:MAG: acetyl-CoA C-acetyltransferase [Planctomycetes bacterium]|nr:acetyl-CoA C-acetyltransferase [Planctomycetota bacterium]
MPREIVVTHAHRTPIGKFLGGLSGFSTVELGTHVVRQLLERSNLPPDAIGEVIMGHGRQAGCGPNPGRQVAYHAGIPQEVPAWTLNMACASGIKAVALAAEAITLERAEIVIAGGMESMTNVPHLMPTLREGYRLGHSKVVDAMYADGFQCPLANQIMGETAETLARDYVISREEQDAYAVETQRRCEAARREGFFEAEIVPITWHDRKGQEHAVAHDEHPRDGVTVESLRKLPPVFDAQNGTVTAGNSSGITDGAAALLVMSREAAELHGFPVLATIGTATQVGVDPHVMGIGPVPATRMLLEREGTTVEDYDVVEMNEAFAAQVIACQRELNIPAERLNPLGGAIALGHPIGCTGARIIVTLLHELARRGGRRGLATLCVSGGLGMAISFTR